jgi:hypothetical protein
LLQILRDDYELVLYWLGAARPDMDATLFAETHEVRLGENKLDIGSLLDKDLMVCFYPEVGSVWESVVLSNLRLAPVQITTYGQPVSTFGSRIDYWIAGQDVENLGDAEQRYSERMVVVPGWARAYSTPSYKRRNIHKGWNPVLVDCPWDMGGHFLAPGAHAEAVGGPCTRQHGAKIPGRQPRTEC